MKPIKQLHNGSWIDFFERGIPAAMLTGKASAIKSRHGAVYEPEPRAPYWSQRDYAQMAKTPAPAPC